MGRSLGLGFLGPSMLFTETPAWTAALLHTPRAGAAVPTVSSAWPQRPQRSPAIRCSRHPLLLPRSKPFPLRN